MTGKDKAYRASGRRAAMVIVTVALCCAAMAAVDGVIRPPYAVKSAVKVLLFLLCPLACSLADRQLRLSSLLRPERKGLGTALAIGAGVFAVILGCFFALRGVVDFSGVVVALSGDTGLSAGNFLPRALYISIVNSLLEEFFFRGFAYLALRGCLPERAACLFSAFAFALYHVAMLIGWFSPAIFLLVMFGLAAGGVIFNLLDRRAGNIYTSWITHICANLAINTVGLILLGMI